MNRSVLRSRSAVALLLLFSSLAFETKPLLASTWLNPSGGDWFDPSNWSDGVPSLTNDAVINTPGVEFDAPAFAGGGQGLLLGGISESAAGTLSGTADLTVRGQVLLGRVSGTGTNTRRLTEGELRITGGDLINTISPDPFFPPGFGGVFAGFASGTGTNTSFTGSGRIEIQDGSLQTNGQVIIGQTGGTGSGERHGNGHLRITNGNLNAAGGLIIGIASGTGRANGFAFGDVTVTGGDIVIAATETETETFPSRIIVGLAAGTGSYVGSGGGFLVVDGGDIEADIIELGVARGIASSVSRASGDLTIRNGDIRMTSMRVGFFGENAFFTRAKLEIDGGSVQGELLEVIDVGSLLFNLGDAPVDDRLAAFAPLGPPPLESEILVDQAIVNGDVIARFTPGFLPFDGQRFDLITAQSLTGDFSFRTEGLSPAALDALTIVRTPQRLSLFFNVPEPSMLALVAIAAPWLIARRSARQVA